MADGLRAVAAGLSPACGLRLLRRPWLLLSTVAQWLDRVCGLAVGFHPTVQRLDRPNKTPNPAPLDRTLAILSSHAPLTLFLAAATTPVQVVEPPSPVAGDGHRDAVPGRPPATRDGADSHRSREFSPSPFFSLCDPVAERERSPSSDLSPRPVCDVAGRGSAGRRRRQRATAPREHSFPLPLLFFLLSPSTTSPQREREATAARRRPRWTERLRPCRPLRRSRVPLAVSAPPSNGSVVVFFAPEKGWCSSSRCLGLPMRIEIERNGAALRRHDFIAPFARIVLLGLGFFAGSDLFLSLFILCTENHSLAWLDTIDRSSGSV